MPETKFTCPVRGESYVSDQMLKVQGEKVQGETEPDCRLLPNHVTRRQWIPKLLIRMDIFLAFHAGIAYRVSVRATVTGMVSGLRHSYGSAQVALEPTPD